MRRFESTSQVEPCTSLNATAASSSCAGQRCWWRAERSMTHGGRRPSEWPGSGRVSARDTAVAAKGPIGDLGGSWMSSDLEEAASAAAGLDDWQLYFLGR